MSRFSACKVTDVAEGQVIQIAIGSRPPLAIYHLEGEFYATDDACTHGDAALSDGTIEGEHIVCPFHLGSFSIRTGEPTTAPCSVPLRTYRVLVEDGIVFVELPD